MSARGRHAWIAGAALALAGSLACAGGAERTGDGTGVSDATRPDRFGLGRPATAADIAALDVDIMPDGTGLPAGRGSVAEGGRVYAARCSVCHGPTGFEGPWAALVADPVPAFNWGDDPSLGTNRVIGNYWPYATTVFDYVRRAMPHDRPGSLSDDEVYAITAWLLWRNGIVAQDAELDAASLLAVQMPARDRFVADSVTRR